MRRRLTLFVAAVATVVVVPAPTLRADEVSDAKDRANNAADGLAAARGRVNEIDHEIAGLEAKRTEAIARQKAVSVDLERIAIEEFIHGSSGGGPILSIADLQELAKAEALAQVVTGDVRATVEEYRAASADLEEADERLARARAEAVAAIEALEAEEREAKVELERLAEAARMRAGRGPRVTGGQVVVLGGDSDWLCPVQGPTSFTNDWQMPRSGGRRHQGNDILSPRGTPVVASVSGSVRIHQASLGGLSYYLSGDDGNEYFGTHLDSVTGVSGRVEQGTVIGYVGNSGNARGGPTHLHFEIAPGGGASVNPYPTVAANC